MERERMLVMNALVDHEQWENDLSAAYENASKNVKSSKVSEEFRKKGNELFCEKYHSTQDHETIFTLYCKSIAFAPLDGSEQLALAYGNRSAFLVHINKYEDCLNDIDRALNVTTTSDFFKVRMLCRKAQCLQKLGQPIHANILSSAESYADNVDVENRVKALQIVDKIRIMSLCNESTQTYLDKEKNKSKFTLPITNNFFSSISIKHTEKYGRYLVASKDYEPGDIIFVENTYASTISLSKLYFHCHYCLKLAWSSIPCDHCTWAVFCSEECKKKAWESFHDIECSLLSSLKEIAKGWDFVSLAMRVFILGINEAGTIANLKDQVKSVDECTDINFKGFTVDGKFVTDRFCNILSLSSSVVDSKFEPLAAYIPVILVCLFNNVKIKTFINIDAIEDLSKNEDMIFLGSLILKLMAITSANSFSFLQSKKGIDPVVNENVQNKSFYQDLSSTRGSCLASLTSLINHRCFPTADVCFVEEKKIALYAMQPIKKNSQIFISYTNPFYIKSLTERQAKLCKYNFICDCQACKEDWPIFNFLDLNMMYSVDKSEIELILQLVKFWQSLNNALADQKSLFNRKDIQKLSTAIKQASTMKQPSMMFYLLVQSLKVLVSRIYSSEWPSFGECIKK